jgi:hypothetical protein
MNIKQAKETQPSNRKLTTKSRVHRAAKPQPKPERLKAKKTLFSRNHLVFIDPITMKRF